MGKIRDPRSECAWDIKVLLDFRKSPYVWKEVCNDGGTKDNFGQVGHECKNVYAEISTQFHVLPNLCDQLWKME